MLLTIAAGPAIAGNKVRTASAQCSAAASGPVRGEYDCNGKTHRAWCNSAHKSTDNGTGTWSSGQNCYVSDAMKTSSHGWPSTCVPVTKHYGSSRPQVWTKCSESWATYGNHYEVMNRYCARTGLTVDKYWADQELRKSPSRSPQVLKLAAHCSAAFLNCEAGLIPSELCNQSQVREIWDSCKSGGTWQPRNAACTQAWGIDDVCSWLNSMCTA